MVGAIGGIAPVQGIGQVAPPPPVSSIAASVPQVRLEPGPGASNCTPCGMEELRRARFKQCDEQCAMQEDVLRQVAAAYAASRPSVPT